MEGIDDYFGQRRTTKKTYLEIWNCENYIISFLDDTGPTIGK